MPKVDFALIVSGGERQFAQEGGSDQGRIKLFHPFGGLSRNCGVQRRIRMEPPDSIRQRFVVIRFHQNAVLDYFGN